MHTHHKLACLAAATLISAALVIPHALQPEQPQPFEQPEPQPELTWRDTCVLAVRLEHLFSGVCGSAVPIACHPTVGGYDVILLTCAHVANEMRDGCVVFRGGALLGSAEFLKSHGVLDAALMRMRVSHPMRVAPARVGEVAVTEDVWAAGYPRGGELVITHGVVGHERGASASVFPGNSGGPVVDSRGRLIGIVATVAVDRRYGMIHHDMHFTALLDLGPWIEPYL